MAKAVFTMKIFLLLLLQHFFTYSHYLVDHGDISNTFVRIGILASSGCSDRNG